MWRTRAVVSMLVEDVAGLRMPVPEDSAAGDHGEPGEQEVLTRAIRRARLVVAVDLLAIAILFIFRDQTRPFLPVEQSVETVFTLGVIAIAIHAGFRWSQLDRLKAVHRLCEELRSRQER